MPMKQLLILRHAKSSWDHPDLDDHDRPLNARGVRDAPRMGRLLRERALVPDWIVSSTATRARETALAVAHAAGYTGEVCLAPDLYSEQPGQYLERIAHTSSDVGRLLLVGHNPTVEGLLTVLTGARETMPTAALALVEAEVASWSELEPDSARLVSLWRPKELGQEPV